MCLFLEYVGLPVPGETLLLMVGFSQAGWLGSGEAMLLGTAGTFLGSMAAYFIGRPFGRDFLLRIGRPLGLTADKIDRANGLIQKHAAGVILLCRYIPGVRHLVPYISGISRLDLRLYTLCSLAGSAIWCLPFLLLGRLAGHQWRFVGDVFRIYGLEALLIVLFVAAIIRAGKKYRRLMMTLAAFPIGFTVFSALRVQSDLTRFDRQVYRVLAHAAAPALANLLSVVPVFTLLPVMAALAIILPDIFSAGHSADRQAIPLLLVNLLTTSLLSIVVRLAYNGVQPELFTLARVSDFGFPNEQAMAAASFYGYLCHLCLTSPRGGWRLPAGILAGLFVPFCALSLIFPGKCGASAVLGGCLTGILWLVVFVTLVRIFYGRPTALAQTGTA